MSFGKTQVAAVVAVSALTLFATSTASAATVRASLAADATQANSASARASISADGRYVAFDSTASNLVAADTNGVSDVFVKDLDTGTIQRVSTSSSGEQALPSTGGPGSFDPAISADGRFVAFSTHAVNLFPNDNNNASDVLLKDTATGRVRLASVALPGRPASISAFGRTGNAPSHSPAISGDGRYVAFVSDANDLNPVDRISGPDIFRFDTTTGNVEMVSTNSSGRQGMIDPDSTSYTGNPTLTGDGQLLAFDSNVSNIVEGDSGSDINVFVKSLVSFETRPVELVRAPNSPSSSSQKPALSGNGEYVAFESTGSNPSGSPLQAGSKIYVRNLLTGRVDAIENLTDSSGRVYSSSADPSISNDGRYVAFSRVVAEVRDGVHSGIYLQDRQTDTLRRVDQPERDIEVLSAAPAISGNGSFVAFDSEHDSLVAGDTNHASDVFRASRPVGRVGPAPTLGTGTPALPCSVTRSCERVLDKTIYVPWPREFEDPRAWPYGSISAPKRGAVKITLTAPKQTALNGSLTLRRGNKTAASKRVVLKPQQTATFTLKLNAATQRAAKRSGKLKLTASFTDLASGKTSKAKSLPVLATKQK